MAHSVENFGRSAVRHPLLDDFRVRRRHHRGAAQLPDLLLRALDHAMALLRLGRDHPAGCGQSEALLDPGFGLQLGHLALLGAQQCACAIRRPILKMRAGLEHNTAATAALGRAAEGRRYGRCIRAWQPPAVAAAYRGASTITIWRPSNFGSCSTLASGERSPRTRSSNLVPSSWWASSRPRKRKVTLTLSPSSKNRR